MNIHTESDGQSCLIRIDGEMTISNANSIKDSLMKVLTQESPLIELDLSEVNAIDTAGVQILLLLNREAQGANRTMRLKAMSNPVSSVLKLYNIQEISCPGNESYG